MKLWTIVGPDGKPHKWDCYYCGKKSKASTAKFKESTGCWHPICRACQKVTK